MTPNEIYELPSKDIEPWYRDYSETLQDVLKLDYIDLGNSDVYKEIDTRNLLVHEKLSYTSDGDRGVSIYAYTLDDAPFAIMMTGGRGGRDRRDFHVTDAAVWKDARAYVVATMNHTSDFDLPIITPNTEVSNKYYDATVVKTENGFKLVNHREAHPKTGNLIYDIEKFSKALQRNSSNPIKAFQAGVLGQAIKTDIKLSETQTIFAVSNIDDTTIAYAFNPTQKFFTWGRGMSTFVIGPGSMLECYAKTTSGKEINTGCTYISDAAKIFGIEPELVKKATSEFIREGGKQVAHRLIDMMPKDKRVPDALDKDYSNIALAYKVLDVPEITHICPAVTQEWAEQIIEKADEIAARVKVGMPVP